jgi:hypothetical protein
MKLNEKNFNDYTYIINKKKLEVHFEGKNIYEL